jgi:hypothetical protein
VTPDSLIAGGATFVALATGIIGLFVAGKIVSGQVYERVAAQADKMAAAVERLTSVVDKQNTINETLLRELQSRARHG